LSGVLDGVKNYGNNLISVGRDGDICARWGESRGESRDFIFRRRKVANNKCSVVVANDFGGRAAGKIFNGEFCA
jgi:hypothetical protein